MIQYYPSLIYSKCVVKFGFNLAIYRINNISSKASRRSYKYKKI